MNFHQWKLKTSILNKEIWLLKIFLQYNGLFSIKTSNGLMSFILFLKYVQAIWLVISYWVYVERCVPVNDVMIGGILELHDDPSIYDNGVRSLPSLPLHDCIWVLKLPPEFKYSGRSIKLFLRIDEMKIDGKIFQSLHVKFRSFKM